jgi:hypothetical protein
MALVQFSPVGPELRLEVAWHFAEVIPLSFAFAGY